MSDERSGDAGGIYVDGEVDDGIYERERLRRSSERGLDDRGRGGRGVGLRCWSDH